MAHAKDNNVLETTKSRAAALRICSFAILLTGAVLLSGCGGDSQRVRRVTSSCACGTQDQDLDSLRQLADLVDRTHYGDTFPDDVPFRWAKGPSDAYAFTSYNDRAIYFVRPNFRRDWTHNLTVVMHEMAHYAVGPHHGHDAVWRREFTRLQGTATAKEFTKVRARSVKRASRRRDRR